MNLELEVESIRDNKLLSRKELRMVVHHPGAGIPDKESLRDKISELYQTNKKNIVVANLKNRYGTYRTTLNARIYPNTDALTSTEKKSVVARLTGEEIKKTPRRIRKDERKKRYKMFGTLRRNMRKAERKNQ